MERTLYVDSEFQSPYAMSAFVCLRFKGLDFHLSQIDLNVGEQFRDSYALLSVTSRVPTLVEGTFAVSESTAIAEYLDEQYAGAPLYPRDPHERALVRQVQAWLRSDLQALRDERNTGVIFHGLRCPPLTPAGLAAAGKLIRTAEHWLAHGGAHLLKAWSIADTDLSLMLHRLICHDEFIPPRLRRYAQSQWERPEIQAWIEAGQRAKDPRASRETDAA